MREKFKKYVAADALAVILVVIMVFAAEVTGEREIIFPEMAALSVGYLVSAKRGWMVNDRRMLALITVCAVLGVLIVRYINVGDYLEVLIAFAMSQMIFLYSGTTLAPFISAIVLPVVLQTTTWVYPVSAFILTGILILGHRLLLKLGIREEEKFIPVSLSSAADKKDAALRVLTLVLIGAAAYASGNKFVIAPPLLVAFTELSRPGNKAKEKPFKTIALLTLCALEGAILRYALVMKAGLALSLAAAIIMAAALLIMHVFDMYMPPAGAVAILSILIPAEAVVTFPLQVAIGISIFTLSAKTMFGRKETGR